MHRIKMTTSEWRAYVKRQLDAPKDKGTYFRIQMARAVPISLLLAIIFSAITIKFWGIKEYARMVMQLLLGLTLAAAVVGPFLKRLEQKFEDE